MSGLKRSIIILAIYFVSLYLLGEEVFSEHPIINISTYFFFLIIIALPGTVFIPQFNRGNRIFLIVFWALLYLALPRIFEHWLSAPESYDLILVELVLLSLGVWLAHQLATELTYTDSLLDMMAQNTFPSNASQLDASYRQLANEVIRCRRYGRPLSLLIFQAIPENEQVIRDMLKNFQQDLLSRISTARVGHLISEHIRQMDLLTRDHVGRFVILCPETDKKSAMMLGERIFESLSKETGFSIKWGMAAFPDEALTFDDLLALAREKLKSTDLQDSEL